ncbi:hypothetical protein MUY21_08500 [Aliiroseovarius sp. S2029]|uniref:hypothetical protein n=1 Tax=Aliiroseovarius sp. S2029 TaxID=2936988 RepID=UPI0020C02AF9|nr:hypothetical protein [Aliiroseovarius sp. S2029]MCK8484074.1 hypothetical protein [Aliiroseovarius sp. S2029]
MTSNDDNDWRQITTKEAFVRTFADKVLVGDGMEFTIHSDGRMSGRINGEVLTGNWYWSGKFFCRTAMWRGEDLGLDCETIEARRSQMRYTRDKGRGEASVVEIKLP